MKKILFIEASPRSGESLTSNMAMRLIEKLQDKDQWELDQLNLWNAELPEINGDTLSAKYAVFAGAEMTQVQRNNWQKLNQFVEQFAAADLVIIGAPMWNWGIPYRLKHYVDVITQPQLTFNWTPEEGYVPILPPRDVVVVTSSGGDYTAGSGNEHEDFAYRYLGLWLEGCMGCQVEFIHMTMTATGPAGIEKATQTAEEQIKDYVRTLTLSAA
ncbi:MAG: NAD(P)H-dependent oxidoreductase [Pseudomonadales bacterium]|nr:NAD(P)H-dependent oxidoreductase [Pseudomonadales bacterium]